MKVLERVLEKRIRCQVSIDNMQFGFMPGKGTTDAIFIMRQVQEKYQAKKKTLYYAFVDLEKAFDRVPREVVRWALWKLYVDEWLIRTVMALYTEACTVVRTDAGESKSFEVKVGLHQWSVLIPLLFSAVMDVVSSEARSGLRAGKHTTVHGVHHTCDKLSRRKQRCVKNAAPVIMPRWYLSSVCEPGPRIELFHQYIFNAFSFVVLTNEVRQALK